jgi:hypothetical protein
MFSESVCQVARSWVVLGSFHTRLFGVVYFAIASVRKFLDKSSYKMLGVAMEMQQWAPFAPFLNYKKFRTAVLTIQMCVGLHVKCKILLSDFNQIWILSTDFGKTRNVKFRKNPSIASREDT